MANEKISFIAEAIGFKKVAKEVSLVTAGVKSLNTVTSQFNRQLGLAKTAQLTRGETARVLNVQNQGIEAYQKNIKNARRGTREFRMEFLSTMFFGMQVWRTFGGFFKSMIQSYKDVDQKGNRPLNQALTKLSASFTFLKFSILDAMSGGLTKFVLWLADTAMWISDLDPAILSAIGWGIAGIATIGLAAFAGSQIKLFADALGSILALSKIKHGDITKLGTSLSNLALAGGLFVGGWLLWQGFKGFKDEGATISENLVTTIQSSLGTAILAGIGTYWITGGVSTALGASMWGFGVAIPLSVGIILLWKILKSERMNELQSRVTDFRDTLEELDVTKSETLSKIPDEVRNELKPSWKGFFEQMGSSIKDILDPESISTFKNILMQSVKDLTTEMDKWDDWEPKDKTVTVKVKYEKEGSDDDISSDAQSTTVYGSGA